MCEEPEESQSGYNSEEEGNLCIKSERQTQMELSMGPLWGLVDYGQEFGFYSKVNEKLLQGSGMI